MRRAWWKRSLCLAVLLCAAVVIPAASAAAASNPCTPPVTNAVACENTLPGDPPSDWAVQGIGDAAIQGYSTQFSVNAGQTESFKVKTVSTNYHIDILRLGYYAGNGARIIQAGIKPTATLPQTQPACQTTAGTGLIDCGNWSVSASWTVPSTAVSGVYVAHLVRDDASNPNGGSLIPFVVRNDSSHSDIVVATSDATWQAYNNYGGNSLYDCTISCPPGNPLAYKGADAVSYNRPFDGALTTDNGASYLFYAEYQMIRFLERNGYDASYISDSDLNDNGSLLLNHKIFISSGHDEYWSGNEYVNVKNALAHGVSLAFFSGNEMFWKTRWAADSSGAADRTLITYKETHYNAPTDPQDPTTWTGSWADPRFSPPADGGVPANALTGQEFVVNSGTSDITVPSQYSKLRLWRNTSIANLASGQTATLGAGIGTLGYEWDEDVDNGFRPAGEFDLSSTTVGNTESFHDYGSILGTTTETHHLSLYRAPSGALVFGAGTVQWAWGLDNTDAWDVGTTDPSGKAPDPNMQQATVNLFADMGVQPATLMSGMAAAAQSTDATPPISSITSPTPNANFADGGAQTIAGTATDSGGGVVAGVEVSTDGGTTWHPATITTPDGVTVSWTYKWTAQGDPSTTIMSRATDDSGNVETPGPGVSVNVACPCSLWGSGTPGGTPLDSADPNAITVGMKFKSDVFGTVSAIRFYKVAANTGTHIGSLWTSTGTLLASVSFSGESASGWQQANLSQPVPIMPNTTYVVSYYAPNGHYAATDNYFYPKPAPGPIGGGTMDNAPLHAISQNTSGNGVYLYGSNSFPTNSDIAADNYWVDVQFGASPAPGPATNVKAVAGNSSAQLTWNAPTTGGPVTSYVITPYLNGAAQSTSAVNGSPAPTGTTVTGLTNGSPYTFTVTATNPTGSAAASAQSNQITPSAAIVAFVQQASAHTPGAGSFGVTLPNPVIAGNRIVVVSGIWNSSNSTATGVTDTAGNTYTELLHFKASDGTEMSVWSAPITAGGGTKPTVTVKTTGTADMAVSASEYSGLATASDASVLDKSAQNSGTTGGTGATVSSGATAATTSGNELVIGAYVDSGFGDNLTGATGYNVRSNISNVGDMEILTEDQVSPTAGATPNASVGTGANTIWDIATFTLKPGASGPPTAPAAPTGVTATAGNGSASLTWTAPSNGGSPITSYTVTPFIGATAQSPVTVSPPVTNAAVTGLTNGTPYTFKVSATNSVGTSVQSAASNSVTPSGPTAPGAPTNVTASAGNGSATVSWTAPSSNGGSPITSYTVTPSTGGVAGTPVQVAGTATSTNVTGLTNGSAYTFTVTATNAIDTGPASAPSNSVTPSAPTAPGAPTNVTASAGNGSATVSWTAPSSNGGSPITSYTVTPSTGGVAGTPVQVAGTATSTNVTGLTNGSAYTFTVTATNAIDTGPASAPSNSVTPSAPTAPGAPTNVTASAGNGSATVSWTAPSSNGGSPITSYTVTPFIGSTAQTPVLVNGSPPSTSTTVIGLLNGTSYTFTVIATNAIGSGAASSPSNGVTPSASGPPTFVQQVSAHGSGTTMAVTPAGNITTGNRIVVLVGVWSSGNATAKSITDAAGNTYTEVLHFLGSDNTEESVWTAPITAGGGTKPKITVTPTAKADVGVAALEYSGLSTVAGSAVLDQSAQNSGKSSSAATVSSGATPATTAAGELALGLYVDSGFGDTLTAGSGFTSRVNVGKVGDMELLAEDQVTGSAGATPNASVGTGANTIWLASTVVFKHA